MDAIREKVIRMEGAKYCHVIQKNSDVKTVYEWNSIYQSRETQLTNLEKLWPSLERLCNYLYSKV